MLQHDASPGQRAARVTRDPGPTACRRGCASEGGLMENRRRFLQASAAAVTARSVLGANDRVQMAIIGTGNRGNQVFTGFSEHTDQVFLAACDVAADRLDAFVTNHGKMDTYKDYRRVLERKDIDAVLITAPDPQQEPILQAALSAAWRIGSCWRSGAV